MFGIENLKYYLLLFQFITTVIGTFYYYKYNNSSLKLYLYLLWYTCINDSVGLCFQYLFDAPNNFSIYNVYQFIRIITLLLIYDRFVENIKNSIIIKFFMLLYILSIIINLFVENFWNDYFINTFIIGASFITITIFIYLFEVLKSNKILYISESLLFWISFANLIYFVPNIPFYIIRKYYSNSSTIPYIFMVNYFLIFIHYSILILGFTWSKPKIKQ